MKKIIYLCFGLFLNQLSAAPHLELVNHYSFDFINWSLSTQLMSLQDGGYIVQKYGTIISRFDAKGTLIKELEIGLIHPIYQTGTQLKDGRIVFINDLSVGTFFDSELNKLADFDIPAVYPFAPCILDNGKLIFGTYNDEAIHIMDKNGKFTKVTGLGKNLRETHCLKDNRAMVMSAGGLFNVFDFNGAEARNLFQKNYSYIEDSLEIVGDEAYFLSGASLTTVNLNNFKEENFPNPNIKEFSGVDYFSDGRYAVISSVQDKAYLSELTLYTKQGEKVATVIEKKTGGTVSSPVEIINDQFIITNHCANSIVLYDSQLDELNRFPSEEWLCHDPVVLSSGNEFIMTGFRDDFHGVFQMRVTQ